MFLFVRAFGDPERRRSKYLEGILKPLGNASTSGEGVPLPP